MLPHYLDDQGRHTLSPDLFQRDAYQEYLFQNPEVVSTVRYDAFWGAFASKQGPDTVRLDLRGTRNGEPTDHSIEAAVADNRRGRKWVGVTVSPEDYAGIGRVVAWRLVASKDGQEVETARSFLWPEGAAFAQPEDVR